MASSPGTSVRLFGSYGFKKIKTKTAVVGLGEKGESRPETSDQAGFTPNKSEEKFSQDGERVDVFHVFTAGGKPSAQERCVLGLVFHSVLGGF